MCTPLRYPGLERARSYPKDLKPKPQTSVSSSIGPKSSRGRTGNQVHRDEHRSERGQFREHVVDLVIRVCHFDRDLCEVVGMRTRENFFVVVQVLRHSDQVVLRSAASVNIG